jgi:flagellar biosynthetic protein FliR
LIEAAQQLLLLWVLVFCRVGTAFILLPGLSNPRLPMYFRLLLAMAITTALLPAIGNRLPPETATSTPIALLWSAAREIFTGFAIGFWGLCFLQASRFAASTIASTVGLAGVPGQAIDEFDPNSMLATFLTLSTTMLILASGLHLEGLAGLIRSYDILPVVTGISVQQLTQITEETIRDTTLMGLQMAAPFIVYAVVANLALGLCSKFTPQLQVYFATMGFTILVALALLATDALNVLEIPVQSYRSWLVDVMQ